MFGKNNKKELDAEEKKILRINQYTSSIDNLSKENKIMRYGFIGVIIALVYIGYVLETKLTDQTTILLPPGATEGFVIGANTVDDRYLKMVSQHIIDLYLDITPSNVNQKYSTLLTMFDPSTHNKYRDIFADKIDAIEKYRNVSYSADAHSSYEVEKIGKNKILVPVHYSRILGNEVKPVKQIKLQIEYKVEFGQFKIINLSELRYE